LHLLILPGHNGLFAHVDGESSGVAGDLTFSVTHGYIGLIRVGICVNPIHTGTHDLKREVRCVDLHVGIQAEGVDIQRSLRQSHLDVAII
jgi:hypothetical protein